VLNFVPFSSFCCCERRSVDSVRRIGFLSGVGTKAVLIIIFAQDEGLGHPFVSDLASESDDEFDAGDDSDEVCNWSCLC